MKDKYLFAVGYAIGASLLGLALALMITPDHIKPIVILFSSIGWLYGFGKIPYPTSPDTNAKQNVERNTSRVIRKDTMGEWYGIPEIGEDDAQ